MSLVAFVTQRNSVFFLKAFEIIKSYFPKVVLITNQGEKGEDILTREKLSSIEYDYILSFWNYYIFSKEELEKARLGTINLHPYPPEHPGLGGRTFCYAFPEKRNFFGTTLHEMNEKFDNGRIIKCSRWPMTKLSPIELMNKSFEESLEMINWTCEKLTNHDDQKKGMIHTSQLLKNEQKQEEDVWGDRIFYHKEEEEWLSKLPEDHIAHQATSGILYSQMNKMYERYNEEWKKVLIENNSKIPDFLQ